MTQNNRPQKSGVQFRHLKKNLHLFVVLTCDQLSCCIMLANRSLLCHELKYEMIYLVLYYNVLKYAAAGVESQQTGDEGQRQPPAA